jgi:hypothetical protein
MEELESISEKSNNGGGFSVPAGYFEQLPQEIESAVRASEFPGSAGFDVPDGYFENLSGQIVLGATTRKAEPTVKKLNWWSSAPAILAVAASIVLVCLIGIRYWDGTSGVNSEKQLAKESRQQEKSIDYLTDHIDQSTLEDALADDAETAPRTRDSTELAANEDIVNYLIDTRIETSVLEHELKDER